MDINFDSLVNWNESGAAQILSTQYELPLEAPVDIAWQRMVLEVDGWWPHSYKKGSTVLIEPFPGGRWWERFADGINGSLWGHVIYIDPPHVLKVVGQFALPGVSNSSGVWRLEAREDGGTLLKVSGEMLGIFDMETIKSRTGGSASLLRALKGFIETGARIDRDSGRE
jgi:hypothetical protein